MAWNPYQDQKNRAFSSILTSLFPEQTKTLPRILVWSVIFLLDLTLLAAGAFSAGLFPSQGGVLPAILFLMLLIGIFWLQGVIWGWICKLFRKWRDKRNVSL